MLAKTMLDAPVARSRLKPHGELPVFILSTTFAGLPPETTLPQLVRPCSYRQEKRFESSAPESENA